VLPVTWSRLKQLLQMLCSYSFLPPISVVTLPLSLC
jgi:hypothetical protein